MQLPLLHHEQQRLAVLRLRSQPVRTSELIPRASDAAGNAANAGAVQEQYAQQVSDALRTSFGEAMKEIEASPGSPVFSAVRQALLEHVAQGGAGRPIVIVELTDGIAVEDTTQGQRLDFQRMEIDGAALERTVSDLREAADGVGAPATVLIVGFAADSGLGDRRVEHARQNLLGVFKAAGIRAVLARSEIPEEPTTD